MTPLQYQLINKIMTSPIIDKGKLEEAGDLIVTSLISGLEIERAGIWIYKDNQFNTIKAHLIIDNAHQIRDTSTELYRDQFPGYFEALDQEIVIKADDAASHSCTFEFEHGYLDVLDIHSMLDAPIRINGKTVGVVCCEKVGGKVNWSENGVLFATLLADQFGRALAADEKISQYEELQKTSKALDEKTDRLKALHESLDRFSLIANMNLDGEVTDINDNFLSVSGYEKDEVIGEPYQIFNGPSNPENLFSRMLSQVRNGQIWQGNICHLKKDGESFWVDATISPVKNQIGKIEGYIGLFYEITHKIETEKQLYKAENLAKMGNFRCHLQTEEWNCSSNFKQMLGLSEKQNVTWSYLEGILTPIHFSLLKEAYNSLSSDDKLDITASKILDNNTWLHFVAQRQGNWFIGSCQDISRRVKQKQKLDKIIALQETILNSANFTIIATRADGIITHFNHTAEKLLGYLAEEVIDIFTPDIFNLQEEVFEYAKELKGEVSQSTTNEFTVLTTKARTGVVDEREWTYLSKSGDTFPVSLSVTAIFDESKEAVGYLLIGKDLSKQKEVERYSDQLHTIVTTAGDLALFSGFLYDVKKGEFQITNERFHNVITSLSNQDKILLPHVVNLYVEDKRPGIIELFENTIRNGVSFDFQSELIESDKLTVKWLRTVGTPQIEKGKVTSILGFIQDVTAQKAFEEKLSSQALTDELTQIPNRRALMTQLGSEWKRCIRYQTVASVLNIDIDYFKNVNDQWGHDAGDFVLKKMSMLLTEQLRNTDTVGRFGGEEFLIIMPNCDEKTAVKLAEKLRETIEKTAISYTQPFQTNSVEIFITLSIGGCAINHKDIKSVNEWLVAADKSLYHAKQNGRNRVIGYSGLSDQ